MTTPIDGEFVVKRKELTIGVSVPTLPQVTADALETYRTKDPAKSESTGPRDQLAVRRLHDKTRLYAMTELFCYVLTNIQSSCVSSPLDRRQS